MSSPSRTTLIETAMIVIVAMYKMKDTPRLELAGVGKEPNRITHSRAQSRSNS